MTINVEKLRTPQFIFFIYVLTASVLILLFRFIFPGSQPPLPIYSGNWRLIQGFLEIFNLFPALVLSALVIPFGLAAFEEHYHSFSDLFTKRLIASVIAAICGAIIYGLIFFIALPMVRNYEENLRFSGELYRLAKRNAEESRNSGEWFEASQFLAICDRIWQNSPELAALRDEITINLEKEAFEAREEIAQARLALIPDLRSADFLPLTGDIHPVNSTEALVMSRTAFSEERFFDAHWLANLAGRLAIRGSVEAANAAQLSSEAWNMIASLAPDRMERRLTELFNLKLSGYQAMGSGEWIRAFYIFQELLEYTPDDPDAKNFLAVSERAASETAFFIDEMELSMGEILNGAVFSLPVDLSGPQGTGRAVMRFSSLTLSEDVAYGFGFEYMETGANDNLVSSASARYVKLLPFTLHGNHQILVLIHALDRENELNNFPGEWLIGSPAPGGMLLDVSFEDFLLIASVRRGLPGLQIGELFSAADKLEKAGYVNQIFQAEILSRLGFALFFLPMSIFIIVIAWRYRARQKPRYLFIILLPVLPIVFHGFVLMYRSFINITGIWLVLSIGFIPALVAYIVTLAVTLFLSLIILSAQHS